LVKPGNYFQFDLDGIYFTIENKFRPNSRPLREICAISDPSGEGCARILSICCDEPIILMMGDDNG